MSIVESLTNVIVGIWVAYLTQVIVFPWFDIHADAYLDHADLHRRIAFAVVHSPTHVQSFCAIIQLSV